MSLKTATSINIIKANPENALKYNAIFIQLKINAKEPNILTIKASLSNQYIIFIAIYGPIVKINNISI